MINRMLAEVETHLNITAEDRNVWVIFSDDPVMQRKFENIGAKLVRVMRDGIGKEYTLRANQVSFRKGNPFSEERKLQQAERMRTLHDTQKRT